MDLFSVLQLVGSIASIVGLPIAIWQVLDVKKRIKKTENTSNRFQAYLKKEQIEQAITILKREHTSIVRIKANYNREGSDSRTISNQVESIITNINEFGYNLNDENDEVATSIKKSVEYLTLFDANQEAEMKRQLISDAESYLDKGIIMLTRKRDGIQQEEIRQIVAHN